MPELRAKLRDAKVAAVKATVDAIDQVAGQALRRIQELTPDRDGVTRRLWFLRKLGGGGKGGGGQGPHLIFIDHPFNKPGARHPVTKQIVNGFTHLGVEWDLLTALEKGTRPHGIDPWVFGRSRVIRSKKASKGRGVAPGVLLFQIGGRWVAAKHVDHPGTRAYNMVAIAAGEAEADLQARLEPIRARMQAALG